jgi:hypothetical protein
LTLKFFTAKKDDMYIGFMESYKKVVDAVLFMRKKKGKAISVRCQGSHTFLDNQFTDGGEVSLKCWLPFSPR